MEVAIPIFIGQRKDDVLIAYVLRPERLRKIVRGPGFKETAQREKTGVFVTFQPIQMTLAECRMFLGGYEHLFADTPGCVKSACAKLFQAGSRRPV